MSVLCANGTHVYLAGHARCTCGAVASQPYPLSGGIFPGYNPYSPQRPNTPPTAGPAPDVPIRVFRLAQLAGASHLSADGRRIYCERFGATLQAEWDGNGWGSWWSCEGLPSDAEKM